MDKLPQLVDRMVVHLRDVFGTTTAAAWEPMKEAREFYASSFRLWRPEEQRVVLETAMALGYRELNVAGAYRDTLMRLVRRPTVPAAEVEPGGTGARRSVCSRFADVLR